MRGSPQLTVLFHFYLFSHMHTPAGLWWVDSRCHRLLFNPCYCYRDERPLQLLSIMLCEQLAADFLCYLGNSRTARKVIT